jgi:hypothetical protein
MDTYQLLDGIGRNMKQSPVLLSLTECGSTLTYLHIMNIRVSTLGWNALSKGLASGSCALDKLRINLVEFDREQLSALAEGIRMN